jgi:uncharacterized coiled-coil protein SlyX
LENKTIYNIKCQNKFFEYEINKYYKDFEELNENLLNSKLKFEKLPKKLNIITNSNNYFQNSNFKSHLEEMDSFLNDLTYRKDILFNVFLQKFLSKNIDE